MFRYILPTVLLAGAVMLGACSPQNGASSKSPPPKAIEIETPVFPEAENSEAQAADIKAAEIKKTLAEEERLKEEGVEEERLKEERVAADALQAETAKQTLLDKQAASTRKAAKQAKALEDKRIAEAQAETLAQDEAVMAQTVKAEAARKAQEQLQQELAQQEKVRMAALLAETQRQAAEEVKARAAAQEEALKDRVIARGTFTKKKKSINGSWSIVMEGGKRYLRFDDAFKTKWVDDLQIFLSPQSISAANHKNAGQNVYRLAPLKAKKGAQSYLVPDGVDLSIYNSILIHCEEYDLLWGGSDIR